MSLPASNGPHTAPCAVCLSTPPARPPSRPPCLRRARPAAPPPPAPPPRTAGSRPTRPAPAGTASSAAGGPHWKVDEGRRKIVKGLEVTEEGCAGKQFGRSAALLSKRSVRARSTGQVKGKGSTECLVRPAVKQPVPMSPGRVRTCGRSLAPLLSSSCSTSGCPPRHAHHTAVWPACRAEMSGTCQSTVALVQRQGVASLVNGHVHLQRAALVKGRTMVIAVTAKCVRLWAFEHVYPPSWAGWGRRRAAAAGGPSPGRPARGDAEQRAVASHISTQRRCLLHTAGGWQAHKVRCVQSSWPNKCGE